MDENADTDLTAELIFDVKQALRKARPFFPARPMAAGDDSLDLIAETVVEHLRRSRWRFRRLPPPPPHSAGTRDEDDPVEPKLGE